jgi:glutathione synthase/RimK-type ligase-like ATP-grasp enzyme
MTDRPEIALVTETRFLSEPEGGDWYIRQVLDEDALLIAALEREGIAATRVAWEDPAVAWERFDAVMLRTPWNYADHFAAFDGWLEKVATVSQLVNPLPLVRWNVDKHYLGALAAGGLDVVPTIWFERGETLNLRRIEEFTSAFHVVVKPTISAGARLTFRMSQGDLANECKAFDIMLQREGLMVQPSQDRVLGEGELTFVVIDGEFSHAVRKLPKPGDFRVQDDLGGRVVPHTATESERRFAERAVALCPRRPLYARVDAVFGNDGRLRLMELELIEPELFLRFHPSAADALADGLAGILQQCL